MVSPGAFEGKMRCPHPGGPLPRGSSRALWGVKQHPWSRSLDVRSPSPPPADCDNKKYLQTSPSVPGENHHPARTTELT